MALFDFSWCGVVFERLMSISSGVATTGFGDWNDFFPMLTNYSEPETKKCLTIRKETEGMMKTAKAGSDII